MQKTNERSGKSMREKVYLAGRITGDDGYKAKFEAAQAQLEAAGMVVLNPAALPDGFTYDAYMRMTGAMLAECDAVCMLPDWTRSKGAVAEYKEAQKLGKRVFLFAPWEWERKKRKPPMKCRMKKALGVVSPSLVSYGRMIAFCGLGVTPVKPSDCQFCRCAVGQRWANDMQRTLYETEGTKDGCDLEH